MKFDPEQHHRRSIRLDGYDYSEPGAYFVTICLQQRKPLLGEVVGDNVRLNDAGLMVKRWWAELPGRSPMVDIDEYVVMPNHLHGIIVIARNPETAANVGAALRGRPEETGHPPGGAPTLGDIVGWFKTMTTNEYVRAVRGCGWTPFPGRLWQRNYYEHIVRNRDDLDEIRQYIAGNAARWKFDRENPSDDSDVNRLR